MPRLAPPLLAVTVALLAACGDAPPTDAIDDPIGVPPSLREAAAPGVVSLTEAQAAELGVETAEVRETTVPVEIEMPGLVEPSPDDFAAVSAPISGRVVRVLAHEGEAVRRGQAVAVIESRETASLLAALGQAQAAVAQAEAAVQSAQAEVDLQQQQVTRYTQLVTERISPQMRLDQARADFRRAEAQLPAARAAVAAAQAQVRGVRGELAAAGVAPTSAGGAVAVIAPRSGVVDRHTVDLGGAVMAYDEMMTIVGQGEVLARGQATPGQAARIRPGDGVAVRSAEDASVTVGATVTSVAPAASADDRAVAVYVKIPAGRGLRPGQSVRLGIVTRGGAARLAVPLSAVAYDGDRATVFVETGPRTFEARAVELAVPDEETVTVLEGLSAGERVAVTNVFDLKALARFEAYGEE